MSRTAYSPTPASGRTQHRVTSTPAEPTTGPIGAPLILVVLFAIMVILDLSRGDGGTKAVAALPESVVGTWIAQDPRYVDRSIHIDPELVVIRPGREVQASVGSVTDFRSWREGAQEVVRVDYRTEDGPFSIEVMPEKTGMRLRHPAEVLWTRR
jgi:hypothetical protein